MASPPPRWVVLCESTTYSDIKRITIQFVFCGGSSVTAHSCPFCFSRFGGNGMLIFEPVGVKQIVV